MTPQQTCLVGPSEAREPLCSQPRPRSWRSTEKRPLQGSSPNDRKNYPDCNRHKRACVDPRSTPSAASAGSPSGARIPRRAEGPRMRFLRHGGIYRSDVVRTKTKPWGRDRASSRRSAPSPGKRTRREDHALLIVRDEFRPAIPRSGCSPALPVSASPARPD